MKCRAWSEILDVECCRSWAHPGKHDAHWNGSRHTWGYAWQERAWNIKAYLRHVWHALCDLGTVLRGGDPS